MKTQLFSIALELAVGVASFHPGSLEAQNALYFGPPRNLGNLNTSLWDYSGSMTEDGLEIFFISTGVKDENDIWTAKRTSVIDASGIPVPFEEKRNLEEVNTAGFESYSFISPDGLVLYFGSDRLGNNHIFEARRLHRGDPFDPDSVRMLEEPVNSSSYELPGAISCDGLTLLFSSLRSGDVELYLAKRCDAGLPFDTVIPLASANSTTWDMPGSLSSDGRMVLFSDDAYYDISPPRPGGLGNADIWMASRERVEICNEPLVPFGVPVNPGPPINSRFHELTPWISCDGRTLLFSSTRPGEGGADLWQADVFQSPPCPTPVLVTRDIQSSRSPEFSCGDFLEGDEIPVVLTLSGVRKAEESCGRPVKVLLRDLPPAGWAVSGISGNGLLQDRAVEWVLEGDQIAEGFTVSYTVTAASTGFEPARWGGFLTEEKQDPVQFPIPGESRLLPVAPFDQCGGIRCWNILGAFRQSGSFTPGVEAIQKDYLTDGLTSELDFLWFPGARIATNFNGAAASQGLFADPSGRNPAGIPEVFPWNDADGRINLNDEVFGGDPNDVMAYAQCYVVNHTGVDLPALVQVSSDDSIQVLLNGAEVWVNNIGRGGSSACNPQDTSLPTILKTGENQLLVKVFEGSGGWDFSLRFVASDAFGLPGAPITQGLEVRKVPEGVTCLQPPLTATRAFDTGETTSVECQEYPMYSDGKTYDVSITLSNVRANANSCTAPTSVSLVEKVPPGWLPSAASNDGQINGPTISWTLTPPFPAALTYMLKAVGNAPHVAIAGFFSDTGALGKFSVGGGAGLLFKPTDITDQGFIRSWLLLGPYAQPSGLSAAPGNANIQKDYLTDEGANTELTVHPKAGDVVNTHYGPPTCSPGGPPCKAPPKARSTGHLDPASDNACYKKGDPPTWVEWHSRDEIVNFNDFYGGNLDNLMMYAVTYVKVDTAVSVDIEAASDDAIQILLDGQEVWINNTARPINTGSPDVVSNADASPCQGSPGCSQLDPLSAGCHTLMVKVFEGGGDHQFELRFVNTGTTDPAPGISMFTKPDCPSVAQKPRFVRGDVNSDGRINLTDGIVILNWLFTGGPEPKCLDAADTDDNGGQRPDISDAIKIFNWLFIGGPAPKAPGPSIATYPRTDCGEDPDDPNDFMDCKGTAATCQ